MIICAAYFLLTEPQINSEEFLTNCTANLNTDVFEHLEHLYIPLFIRCDKKNPVQNGIIFWGFLANFCEKVTSLSSTIWRAMEVTFSKLKRPFSLLTNIFLQTCMCPQQPSSSLSLFLISSTFGILLLLYQCLCAPQSVKCRNSDPT